MKFLQLLTLGALLTFAACGGGQEVRVEEKARASMDSLEAIMEAEEAAAAAAAAAVDSMQRLGDPTDGAIEELYCCANHSPSHCGTHKEIKTLSASQGCKGFK